jgi:hypothetical protein
MDIANHLAVALVAIHGAEAIPVAERAAENIRKLGMTEKQKEWLRVVDAIKRIQRAT